MKKFLIEEHNKYDKNFVIEGGSLYAKVDYDDVWHAEVDASAFAVTEVLNNHMSEYNNAFRKYLKIEMATEYEDKSRHDEEFYEDYPTLEDYLKSRNINI